MFLPDNLLNPIPGPNPSGESLRYTPVSKQDPTFFYDKIKEARREEEELEQGEWQHEVKKADPALVIKLAIEALANRSKDLQIAAWLAEALLRKHRFAGFLEGLDLLRGLLENFWETLYPELEDGDAELRAAPLEWVGTRLGETVKRTPLTDPKPPLTKTGFNWFDYKQSRGVPSEQECEGNEAKQAARQQAIEEKKVTPEEFDEALTTTKKAFYQQAADDLEKTLESLQALDAVANEKFGDAAPAFGPLRSALEEVKQTVRILLKKKEELEPSPESAAEETAEAVEEASISAEETGQAEAAEAAPEAPRRAPRKIVSEEPEDRDDAIRRVIAVARYWRQQEPYSPVPYLILRGLRWGELRAAGSEIDITLLEAPPTEIRQQIKRAALEGQWQEVLETAETAMGMPCGRGWLDLHRYVAKACAELGSYYDPIAAATQSELKALLLDYPQLPELTLMDDTPTANAETQAWLREAIIPPPPSPPESEAQTPQVIAPVIEMREEPSEEKTEEGPPDAYKLAAEAAQSGRAQEAIAILSAAMTQERSGRGRFQRKIQLAGICMATGNESIAHPILEELANEIERRKLEEWEASETVAQPLALLFRCLVKLRRDDAEKQKVYDRICRLDPAQALECLK